EGSDTLHVTATSTDPGAAASAATADQTVGITVNPVSDTPAVTVPTTGVSLDENTSHAIAGVSVTPATGDEADPVTATLTVSSGTLHVGSLSGVTVTGNDSGTLTVSGLGSGVNTVLAGLTYTANSEFEGSDPPHVTATSTQSA